MLDKQYIYKRAISTYGKTMQTVVAMEEMSELIKELSKDLRGKSTKAQIITEIADVQIMLDQLKIMHEITDKDIEDEVVFKLARLNNAIGETLDED